MFFPSKQAEKRKGGGFHQHGWCAKAKHNLLGNLTRSELSSKVNKKKRGTGYGQKIKQKGQPIEGGKRSVCRAVIHPPISRRKHHACTEKGGWGKRRINGSGRMGGKGGPARQRKVSRRVKGEVDQNSWALTRAQTLNQLRGIRGETQFWHRPEV